MVFLPSARTELAPQKRKVASAMQEFRVSAAHESPRGAMRTLRFLLLASLAALGCATSLPLPEESAMDFTDLSIEELMNLDVRPPVVVPRSPQQKELLNPPSLPRLPDMPRIPMRRFPL